MGYVDFARFYDRLTENVDYKAMAGYYIDVLARSGIKKGELLDLACGSGALSVFFQNAGFKVTGADASEEMLTVAASKSRKINLLRIDMTQMGFENDFDAVICAMDSLNHLADLDSMRSAFDCIYRSLKKGGVFAADLNTPYKHLNVLADNAFIFDYDGLFCSWQNELDINDPLHRVDMYLDFFRETGDGLYERFEDSLSEIAPEPSQVMEMLKKSGFVNVEISGFLTGKDLNPHSEKYLINALK